MIKKVILIFSILTTRICSAQFNDSTHYYLNYISTGVVNQTNDGNAFVLNNAAKFGMRHERISLNAATSWVYGQQNKNLTNNDFGNSLDFNLRMEKSRWYYWGLLTFDKSFSLKINNRFQSGIGAGYQIIDQKNAWLNLSDGFLYEKSDLLLAVSGEEFQDRYETIRNSFRLRFRFLIKEKLLIEGTDFYQPSMLTASDYILKTNTSLSLKIKKWLALTMALTFNRVNRTNSQNLLLNYGITVDKYF